MPLTPTQPKRTQPLSALTRYVIVPLILLALGVRIGMTIERARRPAPPAETKPATLALALEQPAAPSPSAPSLELAGSFQNNLYPSLMVSLGVAYPEYTRFLTLAVRNLPASGVLQLRVESPLFVEPLQLPLKNFGEAAALNPELPWNFDVLRRTVQTSPQSFVATLWADGKPLAETSLVCTVHSVNEAVSRIFVASSGQWLDTSVCFAAFVNEDHPWIATLLQEAVASGGVRAFTGYQNGSQSAQQQVQAIWEALAARGLSYVNVATDSGVSPLVSTQYVRFLDQSVHDQGANCVDASVLFASILRRIGLRPVLMFRPGHCYTGFYDASEGGHIIAFETTYLNVAPFSAAVAEGAKELQSTLPYLGTQQYSIVDIAICRQQGINPIPYQAPAP